MDLQRISRIRIETIRDRLIRSYFGLIVAVLAVMLLLGVVLILGNMSATSPDKRWRSFGVALAVMAVLWGYRVWRRRRALDQKVVTRRHGDGSASVTAPRLTVTDFEPPEAADWDNRRIEFSSRVDVSDRWFLAVSISLVFALFGWTIYSPGTLSHEESTRWDQLRVIVLLAAAPAGFLIWAIVGTIHARKTGVSIFQLTSGPGIIGQQLSGAIELSAHVGRKEALEIELICVRQDREGDCEVERILRPKQKPALRAAATFKARLEIPVSIPIPLDCPSTRRSESDECIRWVLVAKAPRSHYQAEFEVQVVKGDLPAGRP
jgi:hypothetical protein